MTLYDMLRWCGAFSLMVIFCIITSGCIFTQSDPTPPPTPQLTPRPTIQPTQESTTATNQASDMALQLSDIPADYILKDRSVVAYPEVSQLARDLGWRQGYMVSFYRLNKEKDDMTGIRQSVNVYPLENLNTVYSIEKDAMLSVANGTTRYEIPFPAIGDTSIAFRETRAGDPYDMAVYTVLFTKKNVYEKITMGGTTTDYEILKDIARKAAEKIR